MACLDESFIKSLKKLHWRSDDLILDVKKNKKIERSGQGLHGHLPEVENAEPCSPGKIYKKSCQICFCNYKKIKICKKTCSDKMTLQKSVTHLKKFPFEPEEIIKFPVLNTLSDKCEPGKMYRIDCNGCLCQEHNNLICEEKLCLSKESMIKMEANKLSGKQCNQDETFSCVKCNCVNQITECKAIPKCEQRERLSGHVAKMPLALNPKIEKCIPGTMYRIQCNRCYCQSDYTIRCTQKACLNYAQALKLKKQRIHLEEHGL